MARKEIMYVDASLETFISEIRRVDFTKGTTQSLKKVGCRALFFFLRRERFVQHHLALGKYK